MTFKKRIKRYAVYQLTRFLFWLLNVIPRRAAILVGAFFGLAAWQLIPKEQHRIDRHLFLAYGDSLTPAQRTRIGREFFVNSGKNLADVIRLRKHFASEIKPLVEVEGLEHLDEAYRRGKGVIGITGHIGNFELLAVYIASLGYRCAVIGREMYDPRLDRLLVENREAFGLINIKTTDSARTLMRWLHGGGVLGVLIDTDSSRVRGVFVPAFGRMSHTPVGQSVLGLRTGAAFVPIACVRTADNRYKIIVRPEISINPELPLEKAALELTSLCTKALEDIINTYPDQWIWLHNRWKTPSK